MKKLYIYLVTIMFSLFFPAPANAYTEYCTPDPGYDYCFINVYGGCQPKLQFSNPKDIRGIWANPMLKKMYVNVLGGSAGMLTEKRLYAYRGLTSWNQISCGASGCNGTLINDGEYIAATAGVTNPPYIAFASWNRVNIGPYNCWAWIGGGWIGSPNYFQTKVVDCLQNSDCTTQPNGICQSNNTCLYIASTPTPTPIIKTANFGLAFSNYSIVGSLFLDDDGDSLKDSGENTIYNGTYDIVSSRDTLSKSTGSFSITGLSGGNVTLQFGGLPTNYDYSYPFASSGYSSIVTVGPSCSAAGHGTCLPNGSINPLNIAVTNTSDPWFQSAGSNLRWDSGFNGRLNIPAGRYASLPGLGGMPGILFSGATAFEQRDQVSQTYNWQVGSTTNKDIFTDSHSVIPSSYNFLLQTAQGSGLNIQNISSLAEITSNGIYKVNGNLNISSSRFFTGGDYVILVDGNVNIDGAATKITVDSATNSTLIISSSGNITIGTDVGETLTSTCTPTSHTGCTLEGLYSADRSFIVNGATCPTTAKRVNIAGSVFANAGRTGGTFVNSRTLCASNATTPSVSFIERPDFLLNYPSMVQQTSRTWQDLAP